MPESQPYERRNSVTMPDGSCRAVPGLPEVPNYLAIEERVFSGRRRVLSFSLLGVWKCSLTRKDFPEWSRSALAGMKLGVDYIRVSRRGAEEVFLDADRARDAFGHTLSQRTRLACRIIEDAARDAWRLKTREEIVAAVPAEVRAEASASVRAQAKADLVRELREIDAMPDGPERNRLIHDLLGVTAFTVGASGLDSPLLHNSEDEEAGGAQSDEEEDSMSPSAVQQFVPVRDREVGGATLPTVLARDMYVFLGVRTAFTHWFRRQAVKCLLVVDQDYEELLSAKNDRKAVSNRPLKEFVLTLNAAKEIGMADKSQRGKDLRLYFLDCEARLLAGKGPAEGSDGLQAARPVADFAASLVETRPASLHRGLIDQAEIHLVLEEFIRTKGIADDIAGPLALSIERALAQDIRSGILQGRFGIHPVTKRLLFDQVTLNAWWRQAEPYVIGVALGLDQPAA